MELKSVIFLEPFSPSINLGIGTTYFPYLTKLLTKTEESLLISHMLRQSVALHYPLMCQPEPGRPEICPTQHTS